MDCRQLSLALLSPANSLSPYFGPLYFECGNNIRAPGVGDEGFEVAVGFVGVGDGEAEVVGVAGEEGGGGDVGIGESGAVGDVGEAVESVAAVTDGMVGVEGDAGGAAVGVVGARKHASR